MHARPLWEGASLISFNKQSVLKGSHGSHTYQDLFPISCTNGQTRYEKCLLPITSLVPFLVALSVLLIRMLRPLAKFRPLWMRNFVGELEEPPKEMQLESKKRYGHLTIALLVLIPMGLVLELLMFLRRPYSIATWLPAFSWVRVFDHHTAFTDAHC